MVFHHDLKRVNDRGASRAPSRTRLVQIGSYHERKWSMLMADRMVGAEVNGRFIAHQWYGADTRKPAVLADLFVLRRNKCQYGEMRPFQGAHSAIERDSFSQLREDGCCRSNNVYISCSSRAISKTALARKSNSKLSQDYNLGPCTIVNNLPTRT